MSLVSVLRRIPPIVEPNIYTKEDHGIDVNLIDIHALTIVEKLKKAGHEAYIVGGGVRDLLLGHKPKDYDISTSAKPEEIKSLFSNCILIGRRFRLAHIRYGRKVFEVATFRSGSNAEDEELIVRDNDWGTAAEDMIRRDFTINGLCYDSTDETVIDYVDGYPDIEKRLLRVIGKPFARFKQDPVRMLRMLKFMARYGFEADDEAMQALIDCRSEIVKSSQARLFEELLRMLESGHSAQFFKLMTDKGMIQILLPVIGEYLEHPDGGTIYSFLQEVDTMIKEEEISHDRSLLLTCLLFPLLERHLSVHYLEGGHIPHLGTIHGEAYTLIHDTFLPFFNVPRRIKGKMASILVSQYRITPLTKRKMKKIRIPRIPDFDLAVYFARVRARLEPGLSEIIDPWEEALVDYIPPIKKRPPRRGGGRGRK